MTNVVTKVHFLLYYHFYIIFFLSVIYKSMYLLQCIEVKLYRFFYFFILLGNQNIFLCLFFDFFFFSYLSNALMPNSTHSKDTLTQQRNFRCLIKFKIITTSALHLKKVSTSALFIRNRIVIYDIITPTFQTYPKDVLPAWDRMTLTAPYFYRRILLLH